MSELLTKDQFLKVLPKDVRSRVSDEVIDGINKLLEHPELREVFRDNLLSYAGVMADGRFKLDGYISACRYVSHKLLGSSTLEAYAKTFPERYQRLLDEGTDNSSIAAYAAAFNKTMLVNKIWEQTLIPTHVLNADVFQKAINTQAYLMVNANSEKVRTDAANSILNHLKKPEASKIQLDISYKEDKTLEDLRASTQALVDLQRRMLEEKVIDAKYVAESVIIPKDIEDAEYVELR
jgi:hypothetical protein